MASTNEPPKLESPGPDDPRYVVRFRLPAGDNNQERIVRMERRFPLACLAGAVAYLPETADVHNIDDFVHVFTDKDGKYNTVKSTKFWAAFGSTIFAPRNKTYYCIEWPKDFTFIEVFDAFRLLGPFNLIYRLIRVLAAAPKTERDDFFIATAQEAASSEARSRGNEAAVVAGWLLYWMYTHHLEEGSNTVEGIAILMKAAEAGHPFAMYECAVMLSIGVSGMQRDINREQAFLKKAADEGIHRAMYIVSLREQSHTEKVKWFVRAAEAGHEFAAYECYEIFQYGKYGQEQNKQKARHYLLLAAYGEKSIGLRQLVDELRAEGHTEVAAAWEKLV